jgi:hypothetical protein
VRCSPYLSHASVKPVVIGAACQHDVGRTFSGFGESECRAQRAQASTSWCVAEHSAMRVEQGGLWLRRATKDVVMPCQTSQCNHAKDARSKDSPALAQLRPEADTAWRWPAGRAGSSTHKNEGRHAARHPLAPLFAARTCRRRAASASARGPWPCSLGRSRWADLTRLARIGR